MTTKAYDGQMLDITAPEHGVQVWVSEDGNVLWVNVDGILAMRICQIPYLELEDKRTVKGVRSAGKTRQG